MESASFLLTLGTAPSPVNQSVQLLSTPFLLIPFGSHFGLGGDDSQGREQRIRACEKAHLRIVLSLSFRPRTTLLKEPSPLSSLLSLHFTTILYHVTTYPFPLYKMINDPPLPDNTTPPSTASPEIAELGCQLHLVLGETQGPAASSITSPITPSNPHIDPSATPNTSPPDPSIVTPGSTKANPGKAGSRASLVSRASTKSAAPASSRPLSAISLPLSTRGKIRPGRGRFLQHFHRDNNPPILFNLFTGSLKLACALDGTKSWISMKFDEIKHI